MTASRFSLIIKVLAIIGSLSLLACSAPQYQKAERSDIGYRDVQVDPATHFVEYTENESVPWEQVRQFVLQRCAEITQNRGYKFFDVLEKEERELEVDSKIETVSMMTSTEKWHAPASTTIPMTGAKVKVKRVTYKIRLMNE